MKILILSDSHRRADLPELILSRHPDAKTVFFLGDVLSDLARMGELFPDRKFFSVAGNCDFAPLSKVFKTERIADVPIFYTHGHTFDVKHGTDRLLAAAREQGCRVALYGHTHIADISYRDGIYLINPGSLSRPRQGKASYATLEIEKNTIYPALYSVEQKSK